MASDVFGRDSNRVPVMGAYSTTTSLTDVKALTAIPFDSANTRALTVAIVDGSGAQITSFGGGTQYADGTTQATPTGTVALGKNSSNVLHALSLDGSGNLNVNVAAGGASGGTSSSFAATFPTTGTAIGVKNGTNMVNLTADASSNLNVNINASSASVPVTGTFWQATQPVSAASLPLPTGAATAAKQPALGTAGTASSDVITVQGIASMTALKVDGSAVTQPVSGTVTANQGGTWTVQPGNTANTTPWLVEQSSTLPITIQTVGIAASTSGDNTLIAAQGVGKKIYVFAWNLSFSGTVNAKFTDGAAGTLLSGLYYGVANAGGGNAVTPPYYLWVGSANTALILNLSAAVAVGGSISYYVI